MKTYLETQGKPPINWWDRIERLKEVDEHTHLLWAKDAESWITCACGNQCDIIPRSGTGAPIDGDLKLRVAKFYSAIVFRYQKDAQYLLEKIEQRSTELINEINNKP